MTSVPIPEYSRLMAARLHSTAYTTMTTTFLSSTLMDRTSGS
ncbi:MAG: hypothetical protein VYB02_06105 [Actinomycetota bacterium]|nr:hypothetical protein [Actinomycetota bacterium]